jgi:hypothetical protein
MDPTDGCFYQGQAKRPSSSNGKEGKLMENPETIGSDLSGGFVLKAFSPPRTTKPISSPLEVAYRYGVKALLRKLPYSAGYSLILDLRNAPLFSP